MTEIMRAAMAPSGFGHERGWRRSPVSGASRPWAAAVY
jgi:hypothetical protein